jgi:tetratricopeptide (TPR) repeat protein
MFRFEPGIRGFWDKAQCLKALPMIRHLSSVRYFTSVFLVLILLALITGVNCAAQETDADLRDIFLDAKRAQEKGDYRRAGTRYQEIVDRRPELSEAWANLGLMHQFLLEYGQANKNFQVALSKNPRLYVPNLFLGLNSLRSNHPSSALRYLKIAENLNPRDEQAALGLARAYQALNNDPAASTWLYRATEISPKNVDAWFALGLAYLRMQDSAVIQLKKAGQNSPQARALLGEAFLEQGRIDDAIRIYETLASSTEPPCLVASLGFAYAQRGSAFQAKSAFQNELNKSPGCLTARLGLARLALAIDDPAEALNEFKMAWDADRNFVRANMHRVWNVVDIEQLAKAAAWWRRSSMAQETLTQVLTDSIESKELDIPNLVVGAEAGDPVGRDLGNTKRVESTPERLSADGHFTACEAKLQRGRSSLSLARSLLLAQCSFYSGNYKNSLRAVERALAIDPHSLAGSYWKAKSAQELAAGALNRMSSLAPGSPRVHLLLAELHRTRQEFDAAEAEYHEVIASGTNEPSAHLGLAHVYYQKSQDEKSLMELQDVFKGDAKNPEASLIMAEIFVKRHRYEEAIPYLKEALRGSPLSVSRVHSLLARCYADQGQYSRALAELKPALPEDTTGIFHYQLYQLYKKLGNDKAAITALKISERLRREEANAELHLKEIPTKENDPNP